MNDKPINREKQKQAHQLCTNLAPYSWNEFAKSLVEFFNERGFLTDKQMDAGERMLRKAKENKWSEGNPPLAVIPIVGQDLEETTSEPISIEVEDPF
tara:strand:- start:27366 stop:27656 length:291 start_codon:yes stop_codon:yes gene_type:complete